MFLHLPGLADENESVREAALSAGHVLVEHYATTYDLFRIIFLFLNDRLLFTSALIGWLWGHKLKGPYLLRQFLGGIISGKGVIHSTL